MTLQQKKFRNHYRCAVLLLMANFLLICGNAFAESTVSTPVKLRGITVGIEGYFQVGKWTELTANIEVSRPISVVLEISSIDPDGYHTQFPTEPIRIEKAGQLPLRSFFIPGRIKSDIQVTIRNAEDNSVLDQQSFSTATHRQATEALDIRMEPILTQQTPIILLCGEIAGFKDLDADLAEEPASGRDIPNLSVIHSDSVKSIPRQSRSLDACHTVVLSRDYLQIDKQQSQALQRWVQSGGHLLLNLGSQVDAFQQSQLKSWIPVQVTGAIRVRQFTRLESFSRQNVPVRFRGQAGAANLVHDQGVALVSDRDQAMIVAVPYGFGRITCVAYDFDRAPLSRWRPLSDVCERLIFPRLKGRDSREGGSVIRKRKLAQSGINDLATQLHATMDDFPSLRRYTSWSIMGWILLYLAFLGPIDFLLVHRVLKWPQLTWVTFPLMVIVATGFAISTARANNGDDAIENQIDLVDIDASSVRINSWFTIYSSQTCLSNFEMITPAVTTESTGRTSNETSATLRWAGTPEEGYGGMYRASGMELIRPSYEFAANSKDLNNLPLAIWSTKSLQAEYFRTQPGLVISQLESPGASQLRGSFEHQLPMPITDWFLAYGTRVYQPKTRVQGSGEFMDLQPNQSCEISISNIQQRDLKSFLTGTRQRTIEKQNSTKDKEIVEEELDYERLSRDPVKMMKMITFHEAAGGTRYTGLTNQVLKNLDFSTQINLDRAVLFGRIEVHPDWTLQYQRDGHVVESNRKDVFVRIVLPVQRLERNIKNLPDYDKNRSQN